MKGIKTENKLFKTKFQCRKYVDKWIFCLFCKYNNNNINQETMEYESDVETISNCSRAISRFCSILANFFPVAKRTLLCHCFGSSWEKYNMPFFLQYTEGYLDQNGFFTKKKSWKPVWVLEGQIGVFLNPNYVIYHMRSLFYFSTKNEDFFSITTFSFFGEISLKNGKMKM